MNTITRRIATLAVGGVLAITVAAPAVAGYTCPPDKPPKCNSGRGNGSEGCDPGRSSTASDGSLGQNQGGDEGGPIRGGTGAP